MVVSVSLIGWKERQWTWAKERTLDVLKRDGEYMIVLAKGTLK